jgi:hypothetical protein
MTWTSRSASSTAAAAQMHVEPTTDDVQGVLGGVEQHASWVGHGEAAQAGPAGGDGDGQIEGEEGFAAFGFAADDADGLLGP